MTQAAVRSLSFEDNKRVGTDKDVTWSKCCELRDEAALLRPRQSVILCWKHEIVQANLAFLGIPTA